MKITTNVYELNRQTGISKYRLYNKTCTYDDIVKINEIYEIDIDYIKSMSMDYMPVCRLDVEHDVTMEFDDFIQASAYLSNMKDPYKVKLERDSINVGTYTMTVTTVESRYFQDYRWVSGEKSTPLIEIKEEVYYETVSKRPELETDY